jgi:HprK-related kinase B
MKREFLIREFREKYPADHLLNLKFGNCKIQVLLNNQALRDELTDYYAPFVCSSGHPDISITVHEAPPPVLSLPFTVYLPDPGKTKIKEEYADLPDGRIVRKRLTGMVFIFGYGENLAIGPCQKNPNQVVNFINNRHIEWELCRGCLLGHAAGVVWKDRGLALAGFSGTGKSTLALHIMNHGAVFISNDRLMIEKQGEGLIMFGVAKLPRINPGTILNNPSLIRIMSYEEQEEFSGLPKEVLWNLEHKYDAPIEECFGKDRFVLDAPMNALVILNWKSGGGPLKVQKIDPGKRLDLLPAFMKSTGLFFTPLEGCAMPEPSVQNYVDFLRRCPMLEFSGGIDFEAAAQACVSFLETGRI